MNVATLQPPAGAGNVVTVFVPGLAAKVTEDGPLIIAIPDPPTPPFEFPAPPPPPPPVLDAPSVQAGPAGPDPPAPPPPDPPVPGLLFK